jgi:hypothetical protein
VRCREIAVEPCRQSLTVEWDDEPEENELKAAFGFAAANRRQPTAMASALIERANARMRG